MTIFYHIDYMLSKQAHDLHVSLVFLCLQFRFIPTYSIEALACTADLRILGINGSIVSDR